MKRRLLTIIFALLTTTACLAQNVVVTIKPLHSLVKNILGETTNAELLIDNNASPHDYQLKPSDVKTLIRADIIFYVDKSFEGFMGRISELVNPNTLMIELAQAGSIKRLKPRVDSHQENRSHEEFDPHIWLNPENGKAIARIVADKLAEIYPVHKQQYQSNLHKTIKKLNQLDSNLHQQLQQLDQLAFIVQHNAYYYFEQHFGLKSISAITLDAAMPLSVKRAQNIHKRIKQHDVKCIFREPQYSDKLIKTIASDAGINTGILDPIGTELTPGNELYFVLLNSLADNVEKCLTQSP